MASSRQRAAGGGRQASSIGRGGDDGCLNGVQGRVWPAPPGWLRRVAGGPVGSAAWPCANALFGTPQPWLSERGAKPVCPALPHWLSRVAGDPAGSAARHGRAQIAGAMASPLQCAAVGRLPRSGAAATMAACAGCKFEAVVHRLACCAGLPAVWSAQRHGRAPVRCFGAPQRWLPERGAKPVCPALPGRLRRVAGSPAGSAARHGRAQIAGAMSSRLQCAAVGRRPRSGAAATMAACAGCKFEAVVHRLACCAGLPAIRPAQRHGTAEHKLPVRCHRGCSARRSAGFLDRVRQQRLLERGARPSLSCTAWLAAAGPGQSGQPSCTAEHQCADWAPQQGRLLERDARSTLSCTAWLAAPGPGQSGQPSCTAEHQCADWAPQQGWLLERVARSTLSCTAWLAAPGAGQSGQPSCTAEHKCADWAR